MTYESPFKPHGHDGPHHDMRFTPDPATVATQAGATLISDTMREKFTAITGDDPSAIETWTAAHLPPAEQMAAFVERMISGYDTWDTSHVAMSLIQDGDSIAADAIYVLGATPQQAYPGVLRSVISESISNRMADTPDAPPIIGHAIQVEAHVIDHEALTAEEVEIARDQGASALPQSQELCILVAADCAGRVWWGTRNRATGEYRCGDPLTPNPTLAHFGHLMRAFAEVLPLVYLFSGNVHQLRDDQAEDGDRG